MEKDNKRQLPTTTEKPTEKKVKVIGTQPYLNVSTGEIEDFQVTNIEERDFNFTKIWLTSFISTLDIISNQRLRVAYYIIDHLNRDNQLIATNRVLAEQTGISYATVASTVKILQEADFLRRQQNGVYTINPNIIFKGSRQNRLNVLNVYRSLEKPEEKPLTDEEKIKRLQESIKLLQKEVAKLQGKDDVIDLEVEGQLAFDSDGEVVEKAVAVPVKKKRGRPKKNIKEEGL